MTSTHTSVPINDSVNDVSENSSSGSEEVLAVAQLERHEVYDVLPETELLEAQRQHKQPENWHNVNKSHQSSVLFIYLKGSKQKLEQRLKERKGHFMSPSLLESQLQCLEEPTPDENHVVIDVDMATNVILKHLIEKIHND